MTSPSKALPAVLERIDADLDKSLDPTLYVDDSHLTSKGGNVFDAEKAAVADLMAIKNPPAGVTSAILSLVSADQAFAQTAIDDAISRGGNPAEITTAQNEMTKAMQDTCKGKFDSAIDHYKHAWEHAQKA